MLRTNCVATYITYYKWIFSACTRFDSFELNRKIGPIIGAFSHFNFDLWRMILWRLESHNSYLRNYGTRKKEEKIFVLATFLTRGPRVRIYGLGKQILNRRTYSIFFRNLTRLRISSMKTAKKVNHESVITPYSIHFRFRCKLATDLRTTEVNYRCGLLVFPSR